MSYHPLNADANIMFSILRTTMAAFACSSALFATIVYQLLNADSMSAFVIMANTRVSFSRLSTFWRAQLAQLSRADFRAALCIMLITASILRSFSVSLCDLSLHALRALASNPKLVLPSISAILFL